jgi:hypothetical protein
MYLINVFNCSRFTCYCIYKYLNLHEQTNFSSGSLYLSMKFMWAGRSEEVGLWGSGRYRGTLVAAVTGAPGRLMAALVWHQLTRQDESAQARALRLLLAAHAVGLQQPGALQREVHTTPAKINKKIISDI